MFCVTFLKVCGATKKTASIAWHQRKLLFFYKSHNITKEFCNIKRLYRYKETFLWTFSESHKLSATATPQWYLDLITPWGSSVGRGARFVVIILFLIAHLNTHTLPRLRRFLISIWGRWLNAHRSDPMLQPWRAAFVYALIREGAHIDVLIYDICVYVTQNTWYMIYAV